jgi:hypothetical protein
MRSGGNFNPEWGYLAPAPSFMRTARLVLVATAVGATAGAGVVLSLVERPATTEAGKTAIAAHALVTSVQAATPPAAAVSSAAPMVSSVSPVTAANAAPVTTPGAVPAQSPVQASVEMAPRPARQPPPAAAATSASPAVAQIEKTGASEARSASTSEAPASVAALAETPPAAADEATQSPDEPIAAPDAAAQKKAAKKHTGPSYGQQAYGTRTASNGLGLMLRHLFSPPHSGGTYYPNR